MGDKLRAYPMSRCNTTQQCVDLVKSLPKQHVYFGVRNAYNSLFYYYFDAYIQCELKPRILLMHAAYIAALYHSFTL
jgi:hypothetical protein